MARSKAVAATEGCGDTVDVKHPIVRRFLKEVSCLLERVVSLDERDRLKQVYLSLAIPITLLISLSEWKSDHRKRGKMLSSFREACENFLNMDYPNDEHIDLIKFDCAVWFQHAVGDIDPETGHCSLPFPASLEKYGRRRVFYGEIHRLMLRMLARAKENNRSAISFFASYLLIKRGWPELCQKKKLKTIEDHQKYLSSLPEIPRDEVLVEIRNTVKTVVRNAPMSKLSPSLNASSQSSRKEGGADGFVFRELTKVRLEDLIPDNVNLRNLVFAKANIKEYTFDKCDEFMSSCDVDNFFTRATIIPEPGKFRMVTAGDAIQYTWLQPLQGLLLKSWANSKYSTMSEFWEDEVVEWEIPDNWVWNSGDYQAATDQLNGHCSTLALQTICEICSLPEDFLRRSGFNGVEIRYSKKDRGELPESVIQTNGQLMGHPLSFPVLCIINLAALRLTLFEAVREKVIDSSMINFILDRTKINGDDILFPCPKRLCARWERVTAEVGLKLSIGKSYASTRFAMVNNVMFDMKNKRKIGYLNQKLLLNHSLKSGSSEMTPFEIGHSFNKMFDLVPRASEFLPDAISRRRDVPVYGYQPNLFVPCELGGFGVDEKYCPGKLNFTWEQRVVASRFATDSLGSILFRSGKSIDSIPMQKILHRMPKPIISSSTDVWGWIGSAKVFPWEEDYSNYQRVLGMLASPQTIRERDSRKLNLHKMKTVIPLSVQKMREFIKEPPFILVPRLPEIKDPVILSYTRESGELPNKVREVDDGSVRKERVDYYRWFQQLELGWVKD